MLGAPLSTVAPDGRVVATNTVTVCVTVTAPSEPVAVVGTAEEVEADADVDAEPDANTLVVTAAAELAAADELAADDVGATDVAERVVETSWRRNIGFKGAAWAMSARAGMMAMVKRMLNSRMCVGGMCV